MSIVTTMIRLRWALTAATLHRSAWQIVGFVLSGMLGFGTVLGVGALAWFVGMPSFVSSLPVQLAGGDASFVAVMQPVVAFAGTLLTLCTALAQMLVVGDGSTMNPRGFVLYGIKDRVLQTGLFSATMCGLPAIVGMLAMAVWSLAYRHAGVVVMLVQIIGGVLAIATVAGIARMLVSLIGTLLRSRRDGNALYVTVMLVIVVAAQLPNILGGSLQSGSLRFGELAIAGRWLAWTPFAAAVQLPFDVMTGQWASLVARLLIVALTVALSSAVCVWCVRRDRLANPTASTVNGVKGAGAFGWMPDSVSGAISARVMTNLRHDPRQAMVFVLPLFFVVVFALQFKDFPVMVWQALIWGGFCMAIAESNGLAYDGLGFTMQAQIGVRGVDDRRGRARVLAVIDIVYLVALAMGILLATGAWRNAAGWSTFLTFLGAGLGAALASLGMAEIFSSALLYPVAAIDRPFSSPQGRAMAQGFIPMLYTLAACAALLPTIAAAIMLIVVHYPIWVVGVVGVINGVLVLFCGMWVGGRLMDRRLCSIVATLDSFASLQR